jgi:hypothetical protein
MRPSTRCASWSRPSGEELLGRLAARTAERPQRLLAFPADRAGDRSRGPLAWEQKGLTLPPPRLATPGKGWLFENARYGAAGEIKGT